MKSINYPKRLYPHIHEAFRLGGDKTHEGRLYSAKYQNEIWREYTEHIDIVRFRVSNDKIHKIIDHGIS